MSWKGGCDGGYPYSEDMDRIEGVSRNGCRGGYMSSTERVRYGDMADAYVIEGAGGYDGND